MDAARSDEDTACTPPSDAGLRDSAVERLLGAVVSAGAKGAAEPGSATVLPGAAPVETATAPERIGRYRVERQIGQGGFGRVFLARDEQLGRAVAIKVPHQRSLAAAMAGSYLAEARTAASLDHPNIAPVFDVGVTAEFPCFIVSKYVDGGPLSKVLHEGRRPSFAEAALLVATVADALQYAHGKGVVHRDVKPENILIDGKSQPFVVDFGLALREEEFGSGPRCAGTPAYMSPEQARREGHRVDGRSDIFSLGIVLYEMLAGRLPFRGDTPEELLERIASVDPRPPRQYDSSIPRELERICLRAASNRASERYTAAGDMADDLRHWLAGESRGAVGGTLVPQSHGAPPPLFTAGVRSATPAQDSRPLAIVPKGLRCFDAGDADFFLDLLPGPRDRDGLPDSIRFWKARIEETDSDDTFTVGLIYGPSGCGKSSMVKAGLRPRLSSQVIPLNIEATADDTEARLLGELRKRCGFVPGHLGLAPTLAALRRGQGAVPGKKVLIILDQFEQWLHAGGNERSPELVRALRHCDGVNVQSIVMVRDDFWMAATRFMRDLEVRLVEGQNSAAVDLFDMDHARKVLTAFGRAFGKLPGNPGEMTDEQRRFVEQAISGLSEQGKVIPVRLALFADMVKTRTWSPASLKEVGGTQGIGVTFLEETFSASTSPPEHRYHQKAAREVLKALLPAAGADIKGHMRSRAELLAVSGYASRPAEFEALIRVLDSEVRLLTPTDPQGQAADDPAPAAQTDEKYYQFTHDYLVPSLREWLTRKQKETRRGRAQLLLEDRSGIWNARPENRQLPSAPQWLSIRWLTRRKDWTPPQRRMMSRADRYHVVRGASLAALFLLLGATGATARLWIVRERAAIQAAEQQRATETAALADSLLHADAGQFAAVFPKVAEQGDRFAPIFTTEIERRLPADAGDDAQESLAKRQANAAIALLQMNRAANVWPLLRQSPEPTTRSYLIHRLGPFGVDPQVIIRRLDEEQDLTVRRALVLSLGQFTDNIITPAMRSELLPRLRQIYLHAQDPGLHAASKWLLRRWGQKDWLDHPDAGWLQEHRLEQALTGPNAPAAPAPRWYVNSQGQTLVIVPGPVEFMMGSSLTEAGRDVVEARHRVRIGRTFAIGATPVTVAQYGLFDPSRELKATADSPMVYVSYHDVAAYCNWLSEREGIAGDQRCYETADGSETKLRTGYLSLGGYRLPTEAELEYATRAGTTSTRYYGGGEELLPEYAWYVLNSNGDVSPVARKLPNDLGLFDTYGNIFCWCLDLYNDFQSIGGDVTVNDTEGPLDPGPDARHMLRQGSFMNFASNVRSASRGYSAPGFRFKNYGFRVVRTLPTGAVMPSTAP